MSSKSVCLFIIIPPPKFIFSPSILRKKYPKPKQLVVLAWVLCIAKPGAVHGVILYKFWRSCFVHQQFHWLRDSVIFEEDAYKLSLYFHIWKCKKNKKSFDKLFLAYIFRWNNGMRWNMWRFSLSVYCYDMVTEQIEWIQFRTVMPLPG